MHPRTSLASSFFHSEPSSDWGAATSALPALPDMLTPQRWREETLGHEKVDFGHFEVSEIVNLKTMCHKTAIKNARLIDCMTWFWFRLNSPLLSLSCVVWLFADFDPQISADSMNESASLILNVENESASKSTAALGYCHDFEVKHAGATCATKWSRQRYEMSASACVETPCGKWQRRADSHRCTQQRQEVWFQPICGRTERAFQGWSKSWARFRARSKARLHFGSSVHKFGVCCRDGLDFLHGKWTWIWYVNIWLEKRRQSIWNTRWSHSSRTCLWAWWHATYREVFIIRAASFNEMSSVWIPNQEWMKILNLIWCTNWYWIHIIQVPLREPEEPAGKLDTGGLIGLDWPRYQ